MTTAGRPTSPVAALWAALTLACLSPGVALAEGRYTAVFQDGTRVEAPQIDSWHEPNAQPKIRDRALLDEKNPFVWLREESREPAAEPDAYVEFVGGDRLPGRVTGMRPAESDLYGRPEDALIVETAIPHVWPLDRSSSAPALVSVRWLSRVVWEKSGVSRLKPGTVFLRDGRRLEYRSLRWTPEGLRLLRENEVLDLAYGKISEVHLPAADPWDAYFEQLAAMNSECEKPIWRIETSDGMRATATADRTDAVHWGNGGDPNHWRRRIQPAWALTPFWVRWRTVNEMRLFAAHRPPLSLFPATKIESKHSFGGGWPPRFDANVQGGRLVSGGVSRGWGVGMHATCRVEFELAPAAVAFTSLCGLDALAGSGGCVQAIVKVVSNAGEEELFRSLPLVGSQNYAETNRLELPKSDKSRTLVLIADSLDQGGLAGADPLDVRDSLDWVEPVIECDPAIVREEVRRRATKSVPAWAGWKSATDDATPIATASRWDDARDDPSYRLDASPREKILTVQRTLSLGPADRWLNIVASRVGDSGPAPKLMVQLDGESLGEFDVPPRSPDDVRPLRLRLPQPGKKKVVLSITQSPGAANAQLDWRAITITPDPLALLPILDENAKIVAALIEGEGNLTWSTESPYAGAGCLKVTGGQKGTTRLDDLSAPIRERPKLGEYRFLRFVWKKPAKTRLAFHIAHDGVFGREAVRRREPGFMYETGTDVDRHDGARFIPGKAPDQWRVLDVDLYGDFGAFAFTGVAFESGDGEPAYFDAIYLARDRRDFELIEIPRNEK